jgi:putative hydrolase of the HAD superfamily
VLEEFKKYDDDVCKGKITVKELWNHYKKDLNLDVDIKDFLEWWTDNFTPNKETHILMEEISKVYQIGIFTNIYKGALPQMFEKGHIPKLKYSAIVESHELGLVKPEKDFFIHAQKLAGVKPREIFFIDDSQENVDLANQLGWSAVLFNTSNPTESISNIKRFLSLK